MLLRNQGKRMETTTLAYTVIYRHDTLLKDPMSSADIAISIQLERMRLSEAIAARDAVVQHLNVACKSIQEKTATIDILMREKKELENKLLSADGEEQAVAATCPSTEPLLVITEPIGGEVSRRQTIIQEFRDEFRMVKERQSVISPNDSPPSYEERQRDRSQTPTPSSRDMTPESAAQLARQDALRVLREATFNNPSRLPSPQMLVSRIQYSPNSIIVQDSNELDIKVVTAPNALNPEDLIKARHATLASLPIPAGIPSDALRPITIPAPFTLHEFLANATGSLRNSLSNYRVFQHLTTAWCPEREEHGYLLTPLYKCNTNPRVITAHRWSMVDVIGRMNKPTECFYNKDGKWYYAGVYKAMRLEDLTTTEWEQLSDETSQILIKETLVNRKNTSPQNVYEVTQLYSAGALKVACVGLQCIGFNNTLYRTILEQASKCVQSGRWRNSFGAGTGVAWATNTVAGSGYSSLPGAVPGPSIASLDKNLTGGGGIEDP
ncbi:hypothetical protein EW146_g115 [Bondarzewia mesenterica]|uniref:DUF6697 domain-containing protein n=1 Tax=Bondarzewia mesenterica TaxID=1095465 RepID=A0A4S4M829_9AGAM|nr:hypothetical protein EW146_g115 [Bondarzewia mesenterica]